jgi:hypothetical protein
VFIAGYIPIGNEWHCVHSKASPVFAEKKTKNDATKNRTFFIIATLIIFVFKKKRKKEGY